MEIDVVIEPIDNGYIVSGKGVTEGKRYFKNLETFCNNIIMEEIKTFDSRVIHHEKNYESFKFCLFIDI